MEDRFRIRLQREYDQRSQGNNRYSLRAFASLLGTDHSSLSQMLRGVRPIPSSSIRSWGKKLGMDAEVIAAYAAAENVPDYTTAARESQVRHWMAEASAIILQPLHWQLFQLCGTEDFVSDSRWVAKQTEFTVDEVNMAFERLLRLDLLRTGDDGRWTRNEASIVTQRDFQRAALGRIRSKAAEFSIALPIASIDKSTTKTKKSSTDQ